MIGNSAEVGGSMEKRGKSKIRRTAPCVLKRCPAYSGAGHRPSVEGLNEPRDYCKMAVDMKRNYLKLLMHFRRHDLNEFIEEHDRLFTEAKITGDHLAVTSHYYSVMSKVIDEYFGGELAVSSPCRELAAYSPTMIGPSTYLYPMIQGNFHFAPPRHEKLSLEEALTDLHRKIGQRLGLAAGMLCVDLGCGIGGVMKDLASTQANLIGITIAANEVEIGNKEFRKLGIDSTCRLMEGDCHDMPLDDGSQDAAYAVYSLKYFPNLDGVMKEVSRILKPGGRFLVYDLIKTEKYDEKNETHIQIVEGLEHACGMPSLHTRAEMVAAAEQFGLIFEEEEDLAVTNENPFHYCFSHSPIFMWLVESHFIRNLVNIAQKLRILPRGFHKFNRIFLSGTVEKIVNGGRLGILSGSNILVFKKKV